MQKADSAVRTFFRNPAEQGIRICLYICFVLCHGLICLLKHFALVSAPAGHVGTALIMTFPFALMLLFLYRARRNAPVIELLFGGAVCLAAMLLRLCFVDRSNGDFEYYLNDWLVRFSGQNFSESMRMQVGEYHVLYQYLLYLITHLPLPWLYSVKAVSFAGDAFLAGACLHMLAASDGGAAKDNRALIVLLLPAVALNGGMFAQCDSLYTAALLWGVAFILSDRPGPGLACMGLALCFKLQAVFLFPVLLLFWLAGRISLKNLIPFFLTIFLVQIPAILGGKHPADLISIYASQTGLYTSLNYGAPNLWALVISDGLDAYAYGTFAIALAAGTCILLVSSASKASEYYEAGEWIGVSALIILAVVFCLPRMHERYTYLAELLVCLSALYNPRAIPAAFAVSLANLGALWMTALPLWVCACLMLAAIIWLLMLYLVRPAPDRRSGTV